MGELTRRLKAALVSRGTLAEAEPISFAGRLDPAASGMCLYIVGAEAIKKWRPIINAAPKVYKVQFLIGISTDTGDLFGKVEGVSSAAAENIEPNALREKLLKLKEQKIPQYASPNVKKILRGEKVGERVQEIKIFDVQIGKTREISIEEARTELKFLLEKIKGNFRYEVIQHLWNDEQVSKLGQLQLLELTLCCSGGTYIRGLCEYVADKACVYSLERIKIEVEGATLIDIA